MLFQKDRFCRCQSNLLTEKEIPEFFQGNGDSTTVNVNPFMAESERIWLDATQQLRTGSVNYG